eukprot:gene4511-6178_t
MPSLRRLFAALALAVCVLAARAELTLPAIFSDHMVLQRDARVPVWGTADAGTVVTVEFAGQKKSAAAAPDGRWRLDLDPLAASATPRDLLISTNRNAPAENRKFTAVLVGEVWLCSGQSNMEFTVEARAGTWQAKTRVANATAEIAAANFSLIRHVRIDQQVAESPVDAVKTSGWQLTTPQTVGGFTAVGYFFAREIFQKLNIPVGLVHASWGGTPVESWMSPAAFASDPALGVSLERWRQNLAAYPAARAAYDSALAAWTKAEAVARTEAATAGAKQKPKNDGQKLYLAWLAKNPRPRAPRGPGDPWTPTGLFNGMINPLLPYALRGALWYQGESNAERASE